MKISTAKGLFLMNLTVMGVVLALAIYQVPQPWRGILVGWLLFLVSAGVFALQFAKHHYAYKSLKLTTEKVTNHQSKRPPRRKQRKQPKTEKGLKVILSDSAGSGRYVI